MLERCAVCGGAWRPEPQLTVSLWRIFPHQTGMGCGAQRTGRLLLLLLLRLLLLLLLLHEKDTLLRQQLTVARPEETRRQHLPFGELIWDGPGSRRRRVSSSGKGSSGPAIRARSRSSRDSKWHSAPARARGSTPPHPLPHGRLSRGM